MIDLAQEKVVGCQAASNFFARFYKQVEWKWRVDRLANFKFLLQGGAVVDDNQQIHIRIMGRLAVGIGTEQDDAMRLELPGDLGDQAPNLLLGSHGRDYIRAIEMGQAVVKL